MGKESLGEYGSGWEWDSTYPYVFDYTQTDVDVPMRYNNTISTSTPTINGTWVNYGTASSSEVKYPFCDVEYSDGVLLSSDSQSTNNVSCEAHAYNAGNYYSFRAASAGTAEPASSSICPKGWMLPQYNRDTDYLHFLLVYGIDYNAGSNMTNPYDAALLNLPLSFLRSGYYVNYGTPGLQGSSGIYRMSSQILNFNSGNLSPTDYTGASDGYSVRCVSKWME